MTPLSSVNRMAEGLIPLAILGSRSVTLVAPAFLISKEAMPYALELTPAAFPTWMVASFSGTP